MQCVRSSRQGTTLIEVLMVCFLICMAIGMIVPGLLASIDAERRCGCLNNMRQVGLALQNYQQQFRVLPPGTINPTGPIRNMPDGLHTSWIIQILPFMEQSGIARSFNTELSVYDPVNQSIAHTPLTSLRCTADKNAGTFKGLSVSNYAGCHHGSESPIDSDNNGVMYLNSRVSYDDISDGSSNTIFFGEKRIDAPDLGWVSGTRATLRNTGTPINGKPPVGPEAIGGFSSYHAGGANIAFGDGSIRFVKQTIHYDLYKLLGNRADGELVGGDAF